MRRLLLALSSASLCIVSFPAFDQSWGAWVALVPWLLLLRGLPSRQVFAWSWLIGLLFFLGSIWWLVHVTLIGWLLLCAYLALYFGAFGWCVKVFGLRSSVQRLTFIPASWVALEYLRSHLLSGFGWNLLAYSQTSWLQAIQVADLTGAWGVSFVVVLVNVAIADVVGSKKRQGISDRGQATGDTGHVAGAMRSLACAAGAMLLLLWYGAWRMPSFSVGPPVRVAVVQGNIPQEEKWDEGRQEKILARYERLTEAAAATAPDVVVWPETSVPGFFEIDEALTQRVSALARRERRPLLVGAPARQIDPEGGLVLNRAALVDATGTVLGRYDKVRLVPFGEFIPGERRMPWLRSVLPPIGDFVPGHAYTVFRLGLGSRVQGALPFSVLICFEDIFPELARRFVREGARYLFVITNDAWFGRTAAAYQHAQASTFRAIELRVPVARAANTGWSGCIDSVGRWTDAVHDETGAELFVQGTRTCTVPLGAAQSLYLRYGDWFALGCLVATVCGMAGSRGRMS